MSHVYQKNATATVLQWVGGIVFIISLLSIFFFPLLVLGLILGLILLGLGEIISLLQGISNRLDPEFDLTSLASDPQKKAVVSIYKKMGKTIHSVEETKVRFHYLVETNEGKEVVNMGFFEPRFMTVEAAIDQGVLDFITMDAAVEQGILKNDEMVEVDRNQ